MRPRSFLLLLAGVVLVLAAAGEADAKEPEWNYTTGDDVRPVAISADGEYIAAGTRSDEDKVYLFDKDSSAPLWNYTAGAGVFSMAISADGEYIAAGTCNAPCSGSGYDDKVYLFDKDSSTPLWSYTTDNAVASVAISADGEYIAAGSAGSNDDKVYLFGKDSSTPLWSYTAGDWVRTVAISADGEYIAAGSKDEKIYLFDRDSSTPLWSYEDNDVQSVAISANGEYIVAGSGYWVYLFGKDSSTPLWSYTTGRNVHSVTISADGEYIAAGTESKVYLFDKDSGTPLWSYTTENYVWSVAISANGEYIAVGSAGPPTYDHKVYLFDKDSSTPLWNYTTGDEVRSVAISADGEYIAAGSYDDKVYLFRNDDLGGGGGGGDGGEEDDDRIIFFSDNFESDDITYTQFHRTSNTDNDFYRLESTSSTGSAYSGQYFYRYYEAGTDSYTSDADDSMITPDSYDRDGSGDDFTEDICVDLRASYGANLTYAIKWDLASGDRMEVRAATDFDSTQSDGTWTTLRTYDGSNGDWSSLDWVEEEISLSAFEGYQTWIDFRVVTYSGGGRGVLLDDLMVVGNEYVNNIAITDVTTDRFTAANTEHDLSITVRGIGTEPQQDVVIYARITDMDGALVWPSSSDWTFYTLPMGLNKGDTFTIDPQTAGSSWNWGWGLDPGVYSLYVKAERSDELMLPDENPTDNAVRLTLVLGATLLSHDEWTSDDWARPPPPWSINDPWSWNNDDGNGILTSESFNVWNSQPFLVVEASYELGTATVTAQVRGGSSGAWYDIEWRNPSQTSTLYAIPGAEYTNLPDSWTGSSYFDNRSRQTFYANLGAVEQISDGNGKLQEQYIGGPIQVRLHGVSNGGSGSFTGYNLLVMGLGSSGMDVKSVSPTTQNAEPSSQLIPAERTYTVKLRNLGATQDAGVVDFTITAPIGSNSYVTLENGGVCQGCPDAILSHIMQQGHETVVAIKPTGGNWQDPSRYAEGDQTAYIGEDGKITWPSGNTEFTAPTGWRINNPTKANWDMVAGKPTEPITSNFIDPGDIFTVNIQITMGYATWAPPGTYTIQSDVRSWTDYETLFTEGDSDGQATMVIPRPDLTIGSFGYISHAIGQSEDGYFPEKTTGGDEYFSFQIEVLNSGTETVGTFKVGLLDFDAEPLDVQVSISAINTNWAIDSEETNAMGAEMRVYDGKRFVYFKATAIDLGMYDSQGAGSVFGTYIFYLAVDTENVIAEVNENNNREPIEITVVNGSTYTFLHEGNFIINVTQSVYMQGSQVNIEVNEGGCNWYSDIDGRLDSRGFLSAGIHNLTCQRSININPENGCYSGLELSADSYGKFTFDIGSPQVPVPIGFVDWFLLDTNGNTKSNGRVTDIYGYYPGTEKGVIFIDSNFDGMLSPGDRFDILPGESGSDLENTNSVNQYQFRLKSGHTGGCDIISSQTTTVEVQPIDLFAISAGADISVKSGDIVQFTGSAESALEFDVVLYEWDFEGDGLFDWESVSNGITEHRYHNAGTYHATLRVTDEQGVSTTDVRVITVTSETSSPIGDIAGVKGEYVIAAALLIAIGIATAGYLMKREPSAPPAAPKKEHAPQFTPQTSLVTIECPGCNAQMKVPKLGKMQTVTCDSCGLSGEIEV